MYLVSPQFKQAISNGAEIITRADVYRHGSKLYELPVLGGRVTDDATAAIRRRCSLEVSVGDQPELYVPSRLASDGTGIWPTGIEVRLYQGVRYRSYEQELIPMGVFWISNPRIQDDGDDLRMVMSGFDRSRRVSRARFQETYQLKRSDLSGAIQEILKKQCAWISEEMFQDESRWMRTDGSYGADEFYVPRVTFDRTDNPWDACMEIAIAAGAELFWDVEGFPVLREQGDAAAEDPVAWYDEGEDNLALSLTRELDDEEAYNGVICTGENSSNATVARAEVWDTNPSSPTYYDPAKPSDSDYGPVPFFMGSDFVETNRQALVAATAKFKRLSGVLENISLEAVANFAHQSNDIIHIKRDRLGVEGNFVLDSLNIDLGVDGTLSGTTRSRGTLS